MIRPAQEAMSTVPSATTPRSWAEQATNQLLQNRAHEELQPYTEDSIWRETAQEHTETLLYGHRSCTGSSYRKLQPLHMCVFKLFISLVI